jgi:hypothetical protein
LFFNYSGLCHIESSVLQLSLFSLHSVLSLLWTQFRSFLDTKLDSKFATASTRLSLSDEQGFWCPHTRSPGKFCTKKETTSRSRTFVVERWSKLTTSFPRGLQLGSALVVSLWRG